MFKKITDFFKSVYSEMKYVNWPSRDDIKEGTTVVILMSAIVAVFLSLVDAAFGFLIRNLLLG
ncbi:MAG: preprotein translocase subunit SecE [Candidatus Cloacimonetes bacterium]|nr:preprotein translocase subunit SecE [Candidatus Cloacimonadota bacterium]MCF7814950.1 preprotein translocase subunit SecE [Candidatus Cloacimonadota bacterium]MCF7869238.1 preprotein translocase subunit SecE [Candidatus Cloacimonadota bacterium]MCF7884655.1 preprotein translocase subunit SecE [Candidatus Cloacimonadota bacterium]